MRNLGKVGGQHVHVFQGEADGPTRLLSTCLGGGAIGHDDHQLGAEVGEDVGAGLAKTVAPGQQHDHGGDAPGHAEHGKRGAAAIVPHGVIGFLKQIAKHIW